MNYAKAAELISKARNKAEGKPLANNTRLMVRGNDFAIRLHNTDVVTLHADGSITLNTGGWRTVTTKARINEYAPVRLWSERGVWSFSYQGKTYLYDDGVKLFPDGTVTGDAPESAKAEDKRLRKAAKQYAAKFTDKLFNGEIEAPSMGDCWGCCMKTAEGIQPMGGKSHILSHFDESYFVPSLLVNALEHGSSIAAKQTAQAFMHNKPEHAFTKDRGSFLAKQIETAIRKHCLRQLGMAT